MTVKVRSLGVGHMEFLQLAHYYIPPSRRVEWLKKAGECSEFMLEEINGVDGNVSMIVHQTPERWWSR